MSLTEQPVTKSKPNSYEKRNGQYIVHDIPKTFFSYSQLVYYPANKGYGNEYGLDKTNVHDGKNNLLNDCLIELSVIFNS
jgi:hypothetical protein